MYLAHQLVPTECYNVSYNTHNTSIHRRYLRVYEYFRESICAWHIIDRTFTVKEKEVRGWNFHLAHSVSKFIYKQLKPPYVHLRQERTISEINVSPGCLNRSCFRFSWRKQRWDASSLINKYGGGMKWNSLKRRERALRMWLYIRPDSSLLGVIILMNKRLILIIMSWKFRWPITFVVSQRLIRNSKIESPLKPDDENADEAHYIPSDTVRESRNGFASWPLRCIVIITSTIVEYRVHNWDGFGLWLS